MAINVRDVRDHVRADVRAKCIAALGVCGMCGHFCPHVRARYAGAAISGAKQSRVYMASRTSRTCRTAHAGQGVRAFRPAHTSPHSPHTVARAHFSSILNLEKNGSGGSDND
ncbi:hypothetical protein SN15_14685 [Stenotrophomonas maltophilia]|nr:hypothetical protein SN15_14685 [Stenotrophomonas maltophilia]